MKPAPRLEPPSTTTAHTCRDSSSMCNAHAHASLLTLTIHHLAGADAKQTESGMPSFSQRTILAGLPEQPHPARSPRLHPLACMACLEYMHACHAPLKGADARSGYHLAAQLLGRRQQPTTQERVERAAVAWCLSGWRFVALTYAGNACFCFPSSIHGGALLFQTCTASSLNAALLACGAMYVCLGGWQVDGGSLPGSWWV